MTQKIFLNDGIVDAKDACVNVQDTGLLYGAGLFETMRARGGEVFAVEDHLDRLLDSAETLEVSHSFEKAFLKKAIEKTLAVNELAEARVRLTLTNGCPDEEGQARPTLFITTIPYQPYPEEYYKRGIKAALTECRQNPSDPMCGHKTTSYYNRLFILHQAHRKGCAEALWFTLNNYLAEGCVSNVFLVKDGYLKTPGLDTPVLPGVMRKHVLGIAKSEGIKTEETRLTIEDMLGADEMFVTNVIMGVLPVASFESHTIKEGQPGSITNKIMKIANGLLGENDESA